MTTAGANEIRRAAALALRREKIAQEALRDERSGVVDRFGSDKQYLAALVGDTVDLRRARSGEVIS